MTDLFVSTFGPERGAERTIMCLHGIEAHGVRFVRTAAGLPTTRLVAPDLRGHGRSPMEGPWTLEQHVADLLPILVELGPQTVLLGHSYGGLIAWELARAAPDRISGLVLVDPAIAIQPSLAQQGVDGAISDRSWPSVADALRELLAENPVDAHWSVALDVAVGMRTEADGSVRPLVAAEATRAGWHQMQAPLAESAYRGPTLLIEAEREHGLYVSPQLVAAMRGMLGAKLEHVVVDAAHSIPSLAPELLADQLRAFTTRLPDATRS